MPDKKIDISGSEHRPSSALDALIKACNYKKQGNYSQAFIEGVSSLQLAIREHFNVQCELPKELNEEMERFWQLPVHSQLVALSSSMEGLSYDDIAMAIEAIEISHNIEERDLIPAIDSALLEKLATLFSVNARLLSDKSIDLSAL